MLDVSTKLDVSKKNSVVTHFQNETSPVSQDTTYLRRKIVDLEKTIADLNKFIRMKDLQFEDEHCNNKRLLAELKKERVRNRNLEKQLDVEKCMHEREKARLLEKIRHRKCAINNSKENNFQRERRQLERECDALRVENEDLKDELNEKSETTYNLCIKFLRLKHAKDITERKLDCLLHEHFEILTEMMNKLDEAKKEFDAIISDKFQRPLSLNKASFFQAMQKNVRLVHENARLKVRVRYLNEVVEKLKCYTQKSDTIKFDPSVVTKLISHCSKTYSDEFMKLFPFEDHDKKTNKSALKSSQINRNRNNSRNAKIISKMRLKENFRNCRKERAKSAPEITQKSSLS